MRGRRLGSLLLLLGVGCVTEYHPEYHPVSRTTYVENVSYPTVVYEYVAAPAASPSAARAKGGGARREPPPPVASLPAASTPADDGAFALTSSATREAASPPGPRPRVGAPRASIGHVALRLAYDDASRLRRGGYARFTVRSAAHPEAREHALFPLDAWGGKDFDVQRDPADPRLAVVRFDVWTRADVPPGAPLVVTATGRGAGEGAVLVAAGTLEDDGDDARGGAAIARADAR